MRLLNNSIESMYPVKNQSFIKRSFNNGHFQQPKSKLVEYREKQKRLKNAENKEFQRMHKEQSKTFDNVQSSSKSIMMDKAKVRINPNHEK